MHKMERTLNFAILDNSLLDSSMGSTQGLLSFMTNASKQIKTYLGESEKQTQVSSYLLISLFICLFICFTVLT